MGQIRWRLKEEISERFGSQIEASQKLGIRESRLSYLVRGHAAPTEEEVKILRRAFGKALIADLFGNTGREGAKDAGSACTV